MKITDDDCLTCAHCGAAEIHHVAVDVFHRREDDETGNRLLIATAERSSCDITRGEFMFKHDANYDMNNGLNPSPRRHGVSIRFRCEHCDRISDLSIAQHKGASIVKMKIAQRP